MLISQAIEQNLTIITCDTNSLNIRSKYSALRYQILPPYKTSYACQESLSKKIGKMDNQQATVELKQRLYNHLTHIVRERDPYVASGGHFLVREYIRASLSQWGKVDNHEFEFKGKIHQNLILHLKSTAASSLPPILIGAHYDAVPGTPGADDNATE